MRNSGTKESSCLQNCPQELSLASCAFRWLDTWRLDWKCVLTSLHPFEVCHCFRRAPAGERAVCDLHHALSQVLVSVTHGEV